MEGLVGEDMAVTEKGDAGAPDKGQVGGQVGGKWSLRCTRSRARFPPLRLKHLSVGLSGALGR